MRLQIGQRQRAAGLRQIVCDATRQCPAIKIVRAFARNLPQRCGKLELLENAAFRRHRTVRHEYRGKARLRRELGELVC